MKIIENENDLYLKELGYDMLDEYRQAVSLAGFSANGQVLDVATGSGRMAATLSLAGFSVLSGDIDGNALDKARDRLRKSGLGGVKLIEMDARSIPFDNKFASVICANAIHHLADPVLSISQMSKACTKDGKLVIIEFNDEGMDVMENLHKQKNGGIHERGSLDSYGIGEQLKIYFANVEYHGLKLNNVWIGSQKKLFTDK